MTMKVRTIEGMKSYWALQAYHKLLLGLKMLPSYMGETYEEFYARVEQMSELDREKIIREAVLFVTLDQEEVESLAIFCTDVNGISFSKENMKNLKPNEIFEIISLVSIEISKIKVNFVTEKEKKNLKISQSTSDTSFQDTQIQH